MAMLKPMHDEDITEHIRIRQAQKYAFMLFGEGYIDKETYLAIKERTVREEQRLAKTIWKRSYRAERMLRKTDEKYEDDT